MKALKTDNVYLPCGEKCSRRADTTRSVSRLWSHVLLQQTWASAPDEARITRVITLNTDTETVKWPESTWVFVSRSRIDGRDRAQSKLAVGGGRAVWARHASVVVRQAGERAGADCLSRWRYLRPLADRPARPARLELSLRNATFLHFTCNCYLFHPQPMRVVNAIPK